MRTFSQQLTQNLQPEDCVIQSMADVSPTRWHLAHTTWFFETFILQPARPQRKSHHPAFEYLFNSYYNSVGQQFPRAQRGLLSRPTLAEVWDYRLAIDAEVEQWLSSVEDDVWRPLAPVFQIGLQHE
ncbi:MAG: DinB family protein, partial [Planctomycetales bacterium]|nr:DinB family protein [Planctomycetales bacterium]